jgi:hypothetical protein
MELWLPYWWFWITVTYSLDDEMMQYTGHQRVFIAIEMKDIWLWCMNIWPWCGMHVDECWNEQNWGGKMKKNSDTELGCWSFVWIWWTWTFFCLRGCFIFIFITDQYCRMNYELLKLLENASIQIFFAMNAWFNHF